MRLHIVQDEKIINRTIDNFESVFPGENKFVILTVSNRKSYKYVTARPIVDIISTSSKEYKVLKKSIAQYDSVIVHFMTPLAARLVKSIKHPRIYWIEWGADLYDFLLEPRGYKLFSDEKIQYSCKNTKMPYSLYMLIHKFKKYRNMSLILSAAKHVRYFVPDSMYDEYPLIKKFFPELTNLEYREFFYYPIDEILGTSLQHAIVSGNSIIIGNSASLTGNHISVLERLKNLGISNTKISAPLSYGNKAYADKVINVGKQLFGKDFFGITDYMSLDDYNKYLLSNSIFIYGNWRQEAVGNILIAMYLGGKVFLSAKNPLLEFYKGKGLEIFTIENMDKIDLETPLSQELISHNRTILRNMYSKERQLSLIRRNF